MSKIVSFKTLRLYIVLLLVEMVALWRQFCDGKMSILSSSSEFNIQMERFFDEIFLSILKQK